MSSVYLGGSIILYSQFYEYTGGPPWDAWGQNTNYPELQIYLGNLLVAGPFYYTMGTGQINRLGIGSYSFLWAVPNTVTVGNYIAKWTGIVNGSTVQGQETFDVLSTQGILTTNTPTTNVSLGANQFINFCTDLSPMLVDPEEIHKYVPAASLLEAAEYINLYSKESETIINGRQSSHPDSNLSYTALMFVKAATIAALGKMYDIEGSAETEIALGDLTVRTRNYSTINNGVVDRASAANWYQLAEILREELMRERATMKNIVRGSAHWNPMPQRRRLHRIF